MLTDLYTWFHVDGDQLFFFFSLSLMDLERVLSSQKLENIKFPLFMQRLLRQTHAVEGKSEQEEKRIGCSGSFRRTRIRDTSGCTSQCILILLSATRAHLSCNCNERPLRAT